MRKLVFVSALLFCLSSIVIGAEGQDYEITAVYGSTPIIDGLISVGEWDDAASVVITLPMNGEVPYADIFVKQDGTNLYIGFNISENGGWYEDWAAVLVDVNHDKSLTLQSDDIGFSILGNGTIAEYNVTDGNWTVTDVSGWSAETATTASNVWQIEFTISYAKIDVIAGVEKTIGVCFCYYPGGGTGEFPKFWPPTPDGSSPFYWGDMSSTDWIPEFPSFLVLPLFMTATLLAVTVCRRNKNSIVNEHAAK